MEVGETFEDTAVRELREELDITVKNLRFFDIFSGPEFFHTYPNGDQVYSVIAMFTADHYEGEMKVDHQEIASYQYF
ncbi:NUDIX domain-containing protein [Litchfieldia alkalitelluris]|uniref:NUDIX domain-containing protein n=1 Tax=Litchfieldia alkalitelluris TaxID=304268 RepID=UPI000996C286|nr:NUDIX domain-containing protein [Litchfieldia alkalitelluris]